MASDLNKVILIGRLTKAPELRYTQSGTAVATVSIANNRSYTVNGERKQYVSFFTCVAWNKLGETIAKHCTKGQRVGVEGKLQQRSWEDNGGNKRTSVEIVVENFQFLDYKKKDAAQEEEQPPLMDEDVSGQAPSFEDALPVE